MAVTIKKIAELAGVSVGTVDRALNNRKGVKQEVAERIREIADSVGYVPNAAAKGLVARRKEVKFGVIIHTPKHEYIAELLRGISVQQSNMKDYGVKVIVKYGEDYSVESQLAMMDDLADQGIQGLVMIPLNDKRIEDKIKELEKRGIFVVLTVSDFNVDSFHYVGCDLFRTGRVLGGLAAMLGCSGTKILYCTAPLKIWGNTKRLEGLKTALESRPFGVSLAGVCELKNNDLIAYRDLSEKLLEYPDIDMIIIATGCTQGVLSAIKERNFKKPVKVIALDFSNPVKEALKENRVQAIVDQHPFLQGKGALQVLFDHSVMGYKQDVIKKYIDTDIKIYENVF